MSSYRFRKEREASWVDLDKLLNKMENKGLGSLREEELLRLPQLYSSVISSLSVAKSISLDQSLLNYLENLAKRAYLACYAEKAKFKDVALRLLTQDIPVALWEVKWKCLLGALILFTGYVAGILQSFYADFSSYFHVATLYYINLVKPGSDDFVIVLIGMMAVFFLLFGLCYSIPTFLYLLLQGFLLGLPSSEPATVWFVYFPAIFSLIILAGSSFDITTGILFRQRFSLFYDPSLIAVRPVGVTVFALLSFPVNYVWVKLMGVSYLSVGIALACWIVYALRGRMVARQIKKSNYVH